MAEQESDPNSVLNFYRKAIKLRKELPVVRHGIYREHFAADGNVYCYSMQMQEQKILVLCSFADRPVSLRVPNGFDLTQAKLILNNYDRPCAKALRPYETRVYLWNRE